VIDRTRGIALLLGACGLLSLGGLLARDLGHDLERPRTLASTAYIGSQACRGCHPDHYESFHRTYHRTMTQDATPASVLGRFDGRSLDYLGVRARMHRGNEGEFLISFTAAGGSQRWRARIERSVGSHRYQQYLAREGETYFRLPIAWDVADQRFIHMNAAFLTPDPQLTAAGVSRADYDRHVTRWNDNCIFCHNVQPNPGLDLETGAFDTRVAELGVACEACHGPGAEHAARNANPLRRYALHTRSQPDPTIRNPARLSAERSSQICGRCHGQRITADIGSVLQHGDPFIPGDDLARHSRPLARDSLQNGQAGLFEARFWPDGTPRLTAYEYQGLLQSPCNRGGELSCESCHAMHASEPSGQLRPELGRSVSDPERDAMCTGCHQALRSQPTAAAHSHHLAGSSGARCQSCHMPEVVYGLVSVRLSHRIEVPDPAAQGRPDACTLCHLDRSRDWAIGALRSWRPSSSRPQVLPEAIERLFAGDPIERAVAAHALGRGDAAPAPGSAPQQIGALLDSLASDPYPAVRSIAWRSLRARLGDAPAALQAQLAEYVPTAALEERERQVQRLRDALAARAQDYPAPAVRRELRASAEQAAIEIGE
jgi:hypothetical protein